MRAFVSLVVTFFQRRGPVDDIVNFVIFRFSLGCLKLFLLKFVYVALIGTFF